MNRVTVIVLALAILVVHSLGIHQTLSGSFAPPYDYAHVAFRLARNLVHHGTANWNPGGAIVESYPSPLWIGICAVAERLYLSPILVTQWVGILSGLGTVVFLAQFSSTRLSGLIAPVLLAASSSAAAAAVSGTEAPLVMLLATGSFFAYERGWPRLLGFLLGLLVLSRPEGAPFAGVLMLLEVVDRPRGEHRLPSRRLVPAFAFVVGLTATMAVVRRLETGFWLSPTIASMLEFTPETVRLGADYVASFLLCSGSAPLVILPLLAVPLGMASGICRRTLVLSAFWLAMVTASGGDGLPMWNLIAPIVPLFFLSVQEAITAAIDRAPRLAPVAFGVLGLAVTASFLVSKTPGNLGPLPLESLQRRWMTPRGDLELAYHRPLGRLGLAAEVRETERLRTLSLFLRDKVRDPATILTLWPGAVGYLSRKEVYDMLGRAYPAPERDRTYSWRGAVRVDLVQALERRPDYVVPVIDPVGVGWSPLELLRDWLRRYDVVGDDEARLAALISAVSHFELISVPISAEDELEEDLPSPSYLLLRRKSLDLAPYLELEVEEGRFAVYARHRGHQQVVDLVVWATDERGRRWTLRPPGDFVEAGATVARVSLLLTSTGVRRVELVQGTIPPEIGAVALSAQLHNPGTQGTTNLSAASSTVSVSLR